MSKKEKKNEKIHKKRDSASALADTYHFFCHTDICGGDKGGNTAINILNVIQFRSERCSLYYAERYERGKLLYG
jgi:hypothetical protein